MSDEQLRHQNDLTQLEQRLLSAFQDPATEAEVMARTHRRLRQVMESGTRPARHPLETAFGPIAATLALVMVAGVVGWRLVGQRTTMHGPITASVAPTMLPTVPSVDPLNCELPVVVELEAGPPGEARREVGFVNTHTGQYSRDTSASVVGLPGGGFTAVAGKPADAPTPAWYSQALKRWLPVGGSAVAPDARSYVWVKLLPEGNGYGPNNFDKAELHLYDVARSSDRILWTYPGSIRIVNWDASGILVQTFPPIVRMIPQGGMPLWWLIDPETGQVTELPSHPGTDYPSPTHLPGDPLENNLFDYSTIGGEFHGHPIFRIGSRDPGAPDWVFYETAPGVRVTIYRGTQGDAMRFDPKQAISDATGIWFSDFSSPVLWRWQPGSGLRKLPLKALPGLIVGPPNSEIFANPAGDCG